MGTVGQSQISAAIPPKEALVPIVEEAGGGLRAGLDRYGFRSPDNPVRGESLYLLHYPDNRPTAE
jgi:hypothetical protein